MNFINRVVLKNLLNTISFNEQIILRFESRKKKKNSLKLKFEKIKRNDLILKLQAFQIKQMHFIFLDNNKISVKIFQQ